MLIKREILARIAPKGDPAVLDGVAEHLGDALVAIDCTTLFRVAHFLAQAAHETDGFKTLEEYASGRAYEGRKDLGNTQPGDGRRYKGRGIFQLTGRANYRRIGAVLGVPLEDQPELAMEPRISCLVAAEYWRSRKLNQWADQDDVVAITKRINGGYNGLEGRKIYLARAKLALNELM